MTSQRSRYGRSRWYADPGCDCRCHVARARFSRSPIEPEMFMVPSPMFPARLLALCTLATLIFSAGCSQDSPTMAGSDAQFDGGATQISGIGAYAGPGQCDDSEGEGSDYKLIMNGDLEGCHYVFV